MKRITTLSTVYLIKNADSVEQVTTDKNILFNKLWIYPGKGIAKSGDASGLAPGKIIPNTEDVYVGERCNGSLEMTPDLLVLDSSPILIELPQGESKFLREVLVQSSNAGNGVVLKFWPV